MLALETDVASKGTASLPGVNVPPPPAKFFCCVSTAVIHFHGCRSMTMFIEMKSFLGSSFDKGPRGKPIGSINDCAQPAPDFSSFHHSDAWVLARQPHFDQLGLALEDFDRCS